MLFWIFLILGIGGIIFAEQYRGYSYVPVIISATIGVILLIVVLVFFFIFMVNICTEQGFIASNQQLYDSLVYQAEHAIYENDNDLGKAELVRQITEWNTDLARNRVLSKNIWVGFLHYQCFDQFDFIPLELIQ